MHHSVWPCSLLSTTLITIMRGNESYINGLYWWGFRVNEGLIQGLANILTWALFSQLWSGGEASCTLVGSNKRPIVCVWVRDWVCVCVCLCDGGSGGSRTTMMRRLWPGVMWWVESEHNGHLKEKVNNINPLLVSSHASRLLWWPLTHPHTQSHIPSTAV